MGNRIAICIDGLGAAVVQQNVEIITVDIVGIAVDKLHARTRWRLEGEADITAPRMGRKNADIYIRNGKARAYGEISDQRCCAGGCAVNRAVSRVYESVDRLGPGGSGKEHEHGKAKQQAQ
ncbi:MAG: hypothetical protein Pars92KO_29890 [Parasphingorhabdus sp.]